MHLRIIIHFMGLLILFLGVSMTAPLLVSLTCDEGNYRVWLGALSVTCLSGMGLWVCTKKREEIQLNHRDGVAVVTIGWALAGLFGAFPYLFSGVVSGFTNAYFESLSGFTTTGASILHDIEALPKSILLWRSQTQWLGGMGIIVLSIAILPFLGVGGMQLYRAEVPSPVVDKLKPRISETAKTLWKVYVLFTGTEVILLAAGGMSLFDSLCHAFCTMPTGGFSSKNASVGHFNSLYLDTVIIIFMLMAGINFTLHYRLLKGDVTIFGKDPECRTFLGLFAVLSLVVALNIHGSVHDSFLKAVREAAFQVSSIITTTGFVTADYDKWPDLSRQILLVCMFLGGMAGSTGGGMKTMRIILLIRHAYQEIFRLIHPHAVTTVKLGGRPVPADVMNSVWGFFILYISLFLAASFLMTSLGLDLTTAAASVAATIGNIGPGLGAVGPVQNFYPIPFVGKWILVFCMLLGRLEIYTVIVLLAPEFWRK
jgi:trk system potassium uptake protein TrkH